jgi:hypothetical protein
MPHNTRRLLAGAGLAIGLLTPMSVLATSASAATISNPEGPTPANGGDNGKGNCGHNSSGGAAHTGDNGRGGGNGGDVHGCDAPITTT